MRRLIGYWHTEPWQDLDNNNEEKEKSGRMTVLYEMLRQLIEDLGRLGQTRVAK
jgi:hypothetical protein